ncbi:SDR family NAD(P)-dependent oxidoreductase [Streptomyces shenzhenensis]|uniref:SDR family NAD(P)-dependent oxidoreductase n=1 Tax=Streptomyces shenzhenensis TaxID=943815 RepID=UPI003829639B
MRATWLLARAACEALEAAQGGVVVTTSISALHPTPRAGAYSVSKAALSMLVRHLALEWGPAGVRVNAVAPGPTHSPMTFGSFGDPTDPAAQARRARRESATPLLRRAESDDIADVVLFLAGPGARHLTGVEVPVAQFCTRIQRLPSALRATTSGSVLAAFFRPRAMALTSSRRRDRSQPRMPSVTAPGTTSARSETESQLPRSVRSCAAAGPDPPGCAGCRTGWPEWRGRNWG